MDYLDEILIFNNKLDNINKNVCYLICKCKLPKSKTYNDNINYLPFGILHIKLCTIYKLNYLPYSIQSIEFLTCNINHDKLPSGLLSIFYYQNAYDVYSLPNLLQIYKFSYYVNDINIKIIQYLIQHFIVIKTIKCMEIDILRLKYILENITDINIIKVC